MSTTDPGCFASPELCPEWLQLFRRPEDGMLNHARVLQWVLEERIEACKGLDWHKYIPEILEHYISLDVKGMPTLSKDSGKQGESTAEY
eukprot:9456036-Karenia_brevis.AAC.1